MLKSYPLKSPNYYTSCMIGGVLSCGLTHTAAVPIDVLKCQIQTNPHLYKHLTTACSVLVREHGIKLLARGWVPTFIGYSFQGGFKFGLYELFKDVYSNTLPPEWTYRHKNFVWLLAAGSAEFFADIALCPFEMIKVSMQISPKASPKFRETTISLIQNRRHLNFPLGSLRPLWSRQIPYTIVKFVTFEKIVEAFYAHILTKKPRTDYSKTVQLSVTFGSGYLAGILCAIVSQPADNVITETMKAPNHAKSFIHLMKDLGLKQLFLRGLGPRIIMIGTLTGLQWWTYDMFKTFCGLGTSGGSLPYIAK